MKTTNLILTAGIALLFVACNQNQNTDAILENENQRHQIMETIAKDPQMMKEMTGMMKDSTNGQMMMGKKGMMQGMMGNQKMMQGMMKENPDMMQGMMQNMMDMAQSDTTMRNNMMGMMTQHREMMQSMMKKMHEKGMMSNECMESCMQKMQAMNTEGGTGNPDNSPQNDHSSHH